MFIASSVGSGPSVPALWGKVFSYSLDLFLTETTKYFYRIGLQMRELDQCLIYVTTANMVHTTLELALDVLN